MPTTTALPARSNSRPPKTAATAKALLPSRAFCLLCWLRHADSVIYVWVNSFVRSLAALPCSRFGQPGAAENGRNRKSPASERGFLLAVLAITKAASDGRGPLHGMDWLFHPRGRRGISCVLCCIMEGSRPPRTGRLSCEPAGRCTRDQARHGVAVEGGMHME